ncbi:polysaccharide pyruvyl transferase family protein [Pseudomonas sp. NPDC077382]
MSLRALVFNDTSYDDHHGCQLVMRQIYKLAGAADIQILRSCPMHHNWQEDEELKREIRTVDLCLVNGEGTMHDDAPAALLFGVLARYCQVHNIPCFLINSVWQSNFKLNEYARSFTAIYVRDKLSQGQLAEARVPASVVPDLTLTYEPGHSGLRRHGVIINGSVLKERLAQAWKTVCLAEDADVRYLSIRTLPPLQFGKGFPTYVSKSFFKRIKLYRHILSSYLQPYPADISSRASSRLRWRYSIFSTNDFIREIAKARGVITGRFHMVTLCMITKTPFKALPSNTHKIEALLEEAGLNKRICNTYVEGLSQRELLDFNEDELIALDHFLRNARTKATLMFDEIVRLVNASKSSRNGSIAVMLQEK